MTKHEGGRYHDGERFLPWYTGPCLGWLMTLDLNEKWVYEFGLGDSTLWYESRGAVVMGVDSSFDWVMNSAHIVGTWHAEDKQHYLTLIDVMMLDVFDFIIIDGDYRDECTAPALRHLKPGGYLIIDNYKQESVQMDWPETDKLIEGMEQTLYKEPGHPDWQTLVVRKA